MMEGNLINDPRLMAEKFNVFFTNVATEIVDSIHPTDHDFDFFPPTTQDCSFNFSDEPLTKSEILDAISQLKNKDSNDDNGLSSSFVKQLSIISHFF